MELLKETVKGIIGMTPVILQCTKYNLKSKKQQPIFNPT